MAISKIKVLSETTINQMAAGEVIENPASVVKELIENALDAGAQSLCIEIKQGGRELIRVSDDGEGMSSDDALLSLERHATSKIQKVEDIETLHTLGFRGEALPSIASISQFSILTSPRGEKETGTYVLVDGGKIISHTKATRAPGTTVEVRTLFFNVPVRRKFQKSPTCDESDISKIVQILALAHPDIQFELISDEKTLLKAVHTPHQSFQESLRHRIEITLGKEFSKELISVEHKTPLFEIKGFVGSPSTHRSNRTGQFLFINKRPVFSPLIASLVKEAYSTMIPTHRHPLFVLHLTLPGNLVDVNVHPQKKEVRLRQESTLRETLLNSIQSSLRKEHHEFHSQTIQETFQETFIPAAWGSPFAKKEIKPHSSNISKEKWQFNEKPISIMGSPSYEPLPTPSFQEPPSLPLKKHLQPKVIFTLVGYILLEPFNIPDKLFMMPVTKKEGGLLLVDQSRALSRITFERLLNQKTFETAQALLTPLSIFLSDAECEIVRVFEKELALVGFESRFLGADTLVLDTLPTSVRVEDAESLFKELLIELMEQRHTKRIEIEKEKKLARLAVKSSHRRSKKLTHEEASHLINELLLCSISSTCPLGKSIALYYSSEDLEQWFHI